MNSAPHQSVAAPRRDPVARIIAIVLIAGVGILAGMQFVSPDKRVLQVAVAAVVFGVAWRLNTLSAIGLIVLTLPFPRATTFGNTNLAFLLLVALIWLLRVRGGAAHGFQRSPIDVPVAGMLIWYVLSFYNVQRENFGAAFANFLVFFACVLLFYLVVSNVRTTSDLKRLHTFQALSTGIIALLGIYEMYNPGAVIVPGWITLASPRSTEGINIHDARIGGVFADFELLAEWTAISMLFVTFLIARAESTTRRVLLSGLLLTLILVLFATVTRGAIISLAAATIYLLWTIRRNIRFVPIVIGVGAAVALFMVANYFVATFTHAGDLFERLFSAQSRRFEGILPEARADLWRMSFNRILEHPWLGHGPHYVIVRGVETFFWPHNGYLYVGHLIGFVGLGFYLLLLAILWLRSRVPRPDLHDANYARAFLVVAGAQLVLFMIDQLKIDFLRNPVYTYQVWLLFSSVIAAERIARQEEPPSPSPRR